MRYEDAINAVKAAIETGYVPGGGVTYLALSAEPFRTQIVEQVEKSAREEMKGIDEETGQEFQVVGKFMAGVYFPCGCCSRCHAGGSLSCYSTTFLRLCLLQKKWKVKSNYRRLVLLSLRIR